jgi:hypothetical protein
MFMLGVDDSQSDNPDIIDEFCTEKASNGHRSKPCHAASSVALSSRRGEIGPEGGRWLWES